MKIDNKKDTIIGCIILIIICVISYFYTKYMYKQKTEDITNYPIYAIGLFTNYTPSGVGMRGSTISSIKVMFIGDNKLIETKPIVNQPPNIQNVGKKFLVIYYKDNPTECLLLLDYPIKDSTDFKRYLEEFKTKPLDISKYF